MHPSGVPTLFKKKKVVAKKVSDFLLNDRVVALQELAGADPGSDFSKALEKTHLLLSNSS